MNREKLDRRDFLKWAGLGALGLAAACNPVVSAAIEEATKVPEIDPSKTPVPLTATAEQKPAPTGTPTEKPNIKNLVAEIDEIKNFDVKYFKMETGVDLADGYITPFKLSVEGAGFNFVALPMIVNEIGKAVDNERLFLQTDGTWVELVKSLKKPENIIMWQYPPTDEPVWPYPSNGEPDENGVVFAEILEPVVWYSASSVGTEVQDGVMAVFAPPSEMDGVIPGYIRNERTDGILIVGSSLPDGAKKSLFSLTPVEIKTEREFPMCQIENYKDCPITVEELFDGTVDRWLDSLSRPFDLEQVKFVDMTTLSNGIMIYNTKTSPNYENEEERPFRRNLVAGHLTMEDSNGEIYNYMFLPVEYADENTGESHWVKLVYSIPPGYPDVHDNIVRIWRERMNIAPIVTKATNPDRPYADPLVSRTFDSGLGMGERFERFMNGDVSALSDPRIVLMTHIGEHQSKHWYE
jgi:hypothetical protein